MRGFIEEYTQAEEGEDVLPRDSKHSICMHGDGRVFIRGVEKDWGLMRVSTGDPVLMTLDFERGVVTFKLTRLNTRTSKERETVAEIPGLRGEVTLIACFGGREQSIAIARAEQQQRAGEQQKRVRDNFADDGERIAPIAFSAPTKVATYAQQIAEVAATMESSM